MFKASFCRTILTVSNTSATVFQIATKDYSSPNAVRIRYLPRCSQSTADVIWWRSSWTPEEPYRPETYECFVRKRRKRNLLLCFLVQAIVSMVRYEIPESRNSSTKFITDSLQNLTVTYVYDRKQAVRRIYSNFEALNSHILRDVVVVSSVSRAKSPLEGLETKEKA